MVTETTTKCDRCGQKCVNGCVRIRVSTEHWTNQRIEVGEDHYEPQELCLTCGGVAVELLKLRLQNHYDAPGRDEVMVQPRSPGMDQPIELMPGVEIQRRGPMVSIEAGRHEYHGPDGHSPIEHDFEVRP